MTARVAVVGGGISGLVSAYRLRQQLGRDAEILLVDDSDRPGGKLRTTDLAGGPLDVGAEAFLVRRPEVPDLATELGLRSRIVHPGVRRPLIWSGGRSHDLPARTLMGIPSDPDSVADLVDERTREYIATEPDRPFGWQQGSDVSVAELVSERFGEQVVRRSVDPLLGGVYSGTADTIGVRAALPTLADALDRGAATLSAAVAEAMPSPREGPVFGAFRGGYAELVRALTAATQAGFVKGRASGLRREGGQWTLDPVGRVDGVVLAVSAPRLAELLEGVAPVSSEIVGGIETASSAVVALAFSDEAVLPENSGILVATGEDLTAKAFTLSSRKWPHLAERGVQTVRVSFGRFGDSEVVNLPDSELIESARRDLGHVAGVTAKPLDVGVVRWRDGLPQYGPGHTSQIDKLEADLAGLDGLEVAGAILHGVGVPACVRSATTAVTRLLSGVAG